MDIVRDIPSITKVKWVWTGLSVCRVNTGEIVISAHQGEQYILLEISEEECRRFAEQVMGFLGVPCTEMANGQEESRGTA